MLTINNNCKLIATQSTVSENRKKIYRIHTAPNIIVFISLFWAVRLQCKFARSRSLYQCVSFRSPETAQPLTLDTEWKYTSYDCCWYFILLVFVVVLNFNIVVWRWNEERAEWSFWLCLLLMLPLNRSIELYRCVFHISIKSRWARINASRVISFFDFSGFFNFLATANSILNEIRQINRRQSECNFDLKNDCNRNGNQIVMFDRISSNG